MNNYLYLDKVIFDKERKEEILKKLFELDYQTIEDISYVIDNYKKTVNKSKNDTIFIRYIALRGYETIDDFCKYYDISRDSSLAKSIRFKSPDIRNYLELQRLLDIDDKTFMNAMKNHFKDGDE